MANLPGIREFIQQEATVTREPTGEFLFQGIGGSVNWLIPRSTEEARFDVTGAYSFFTGNVATDGIWIPQFSGQILNVRIYQKTTGNSGITEVDVLRATTPGGSFASIFSVRPQISPSAASVSWCGIGDSVSGFTAPVLVGSPAPYTFNGGDGFRMDILSAMGGQPRDLAIIIYFQRT